jgi:sterol desaturase/sphingolipid hydroxylase (fatty acid hydroxylase superfamily)
MDLFTLEHSRSAYRADFVLYTVAVVTMAALLLLDGPREKWLAIVGFAMAGLVGWSFIEYLLHRFVLHGLQPFKRWHSEHHDRPTALICTPTLLSGALIFGLVFLPALVAGSVWTACALTLGVLTGYLAYAVTHHATHHWKVASPWLQRRKRWHAMHHHHVRQPGCFGVTSAVWDRVFGTGMSAR